MDLPGPPTIPRIGVRARAIITLTGFAIFYGSGLVAGNIYTLGQTSVLCTDVTCSALVVISTVGAFIAIIGGLSIVIWILRRFL